MENLNYDLIKEKIEIMIGNGQIPEKDLKIILNNLLFLEHDNLLLKEESAKNLMAYLNKDNYYRDYVTIIDTFIENNTELDNKIINLLNRYIGVLNDKDVTSEIKDEICSNFDKIEQNIGREKLIMEVTSLIKNDGSDYANHIYNLIGVLQHSNVEEEKRDTASELRKILKNE